MITLSVVVFVVVGILFLSAFATVGAGQRKKKYCPFCGRKMDYIKMPKGVKLLCPNCKEPVESSS